MGLKKFKSMKEARAIGDFVNCVGSDSRILLVYIFGSTVKGRDQKPADIDVALLCKGELSADEQLNLQLDSAVKAETIFGRRADVVLLNSASPFLKYQVLKYGRLIYEFGKGQDGLFRFKVMTEYFESIALQNFFYSRIIERRRHG